MLAGARGTSLAADTEDRRVDPGVSAGTGVFEWERIEGGLGALQPILASCTLGGIVGGMGSSGYLGKGDRGDRELSGQVGSIERIELNQG